MPDKKYAVTIYTAAPGTLLYRNGVPKLGSDGKPEASVPGHMYYVTSDGIDRESYGFAPLMNGSARGPGAVMRADEDSYKKPLYARTMEITQKQYGDLKEFGENPEKFGFDKFYKDARKNCVDFVWAGLNHAGIKRTEISLWSGKREELDGKVNYFPAENRRSIRTIQDPVPNSPLNKEHSNPMPEMRWWQRPLSEDAPRRHDLPGQPASISVAQAGAANDDAFDKLFQATVAGDDRAFSATAQAYLQSADGQALLQAGRDVNDQLVAAKAQELVLNHQVAPPQLSIRM